MIPCPIKTLQAPYITRNPETGEVSWPPPQIELELMELGLLVRPTIGKNKVKPRWNPFYP